MAIHKVKSFNYEVVFFINEDTQLRKTFAEATKAYHWFEATKKEISECQNCKVEFNLLFGYYLANDKMETFGFTKTNQRTFGEYEFYNEFYIPAAREEDIALREAIARGEAKVVNII